jgi:hypothetical protein
VNLEIIQYCDTYCLSPGESFLGSLPSKQKVRTEISDVKLIDSLYHLIEGCIVRGLGWLPATTEGTKKQLSETLLLLQLFLQTEKNETSE